MVLPYKGGPGPNTYFDLFTHSGVQAKTNLVRASTTHTQIRCCRPSIVHYALRAAKIGGHFLYVENPVGLIALCNPFASAMSVVKRLFMYLIY